MGADDLPFTVREAAKFFHVGRSTVWGWVRRAELVAVDVLADGSKRYRFGDLVRAEHRFRRSGRGRPRNLKPEKFV